MLTLERRREYSAQKPPSSLYTTRVGNLLYTTLYTLLHHPGYTPPAVTAVAGMMGAVQCVWSMALGSRVLKTLGQRPLSLLSSQNCQE